MIYLETERLILEEFTKADAAFILELLNSPGWLRFIGDRKVYTLEDADRFLENRLFKSYTENGFGSWAVRRKADGITVGASGFVKRDGLEHPDLGYAFLPQYFGQGYALEAANACIRYGFTHFHFPEILAISNIDNEKSRKLLEKAGMRYLNPISLPPENIPMALYTLNKKDYGI